MNSETFVYLRCLFLFRRAYVSFYFEKKAAYILHEEAFLW